MLGCGDLLRNLISVSVLFHPEFRGGERGDNEASSARPKALLDDSNSAFYLCRRFCLSVCAIGFIYLFSISCFGAPQGCAGSEALAPRGFPPLNSPIANRMVGFEKSAIDSNHGRLEGVVHAPGAVDISSSPAHRISFPNSRQTKGVIQSERLAFDALFLRPSLGGSEKRRVHLLKTYRGAARGTLA
jgi:hypothetical protein